MPPTETGSLASTFTKMRSPTGETVLYCAAQRGPASAQLSPHLANEPVLLRSCTECSTKQGAAASGAALTAGVC